MNSTFAPALQPMGVGSTAVDTPAGASPCSWTYSGMPPAQVTDARPPGEEHPEAGLEGAVGAGTHHTDHTHVVEHGLAAVGGAAGEVDLELARETLRVRVAQQMPEGRLRPRADVEDLERAGPGEVAALDVSHGVAARLTRRQANRRQVVQHVGHAL